MLSQTETDILVLVAGSVGAAGLLLLLRFTGKGLRILMQLRDDLLGEAARPGVPARLGIVERQSNTETRVSGLEVKLDTGLSEAKTRIEDGLKKTQDRVDGQFEHVTTQIHALSEQVHEIKGEVRRIRNGGNDTIVVPAKPAEIEKH